MSFLTKVVADNLRKPGGGFSGYVVKNILKFRNQTLNLETVSHCGIQPDDYILELGFGPGLALRAAAEKIKDGDGKLFGMDFSPAMMTEAMSLLESEISAGKVQLTIGDVSDLPYKDGSMDLVFHCNCYYFWEDHTKVLQGIHRVLKPNGRMITGLNRLSLEQAEGRGFIRKEQFDVDQYMERLKSNNFEVGMEEYSFKDSDMKYQIIFATKV